MKYKVTIRTCPVGHLRYGHYEGTVDAESVEEVRNLLKDCSALELYDMGLDYKLDDYSIDDSNLDGYDIEHAEITSAEPQLNGEVMQVENGVAVLDHNVSSTIAMFEKQLKNIKAQEELLKEKILKAMEENGIVKVDTPHLTITYVAASDRESFDSKAFKVENPDAYDAYVKMTRVKPSIRIKVK